MSNHCITSICPYCDVGCGISLLVDGHSLINVEPQLSHPISRGRLCTLGWSNDYDIDHDHRITQPLLHKDDGFHPISADMALTEICNKLQNILRESGPSSLGIISSARSTNEDNYAAQKLARAIFKTNNIDHCTHLYCNPTLEALQQTLGSGTVTNSTSDLAETDVIMVIGSGLSDKNNILGKQIIREKLKGKLLIVIDPQTTRLAKLADLHLPLKPGSYIALFNAILEEIIGNSWHNPDFIAQRCEGFEKLVGAIEGSLNQVTELTGLPLSLIRSVAKTYSQGKRAMLLYSTDMAQSMDAAKHVIALSNLALVCGHMGRLGTGLNPLLQRPNNAQGAYDMGCLPHLYPGHLAVNNSHNNRRFSEAWDTELPIQEGLTSPSMIKSNSIAPLRGLILFGEDPVLADTNRDSVYKTLQQLDVFVVIDTTVTETAKLADIILPAAAVTEKDGTFTNYERRVQHVKQVFRPPGEARADWQWLADIAKGMGSAQFSWHDAEEIFNEIAALTPIYSGMTYYKIDRHQGLQWPCNSEHPNGSPILHTEYFPTASGRAQLIPVI